MSEKGFEIIEIFDDGITTLIYGDFNEDGEAEEAWAASQDIKARAESALAASDGVLKELKLPRVGFSVFYNSDNHWVYVDSEDQSESLGTDLPLKANSVSFVFSTQEPLSQAYCAAEVGNLALRVLADEGSVDEKINTAFRFGEAMKDWEWRALYKKFILTGWKTHKNLDEARQASNQKNQSKKQLRLRAVTQILQGSKRLAGGAREGRIQRILKEEFGITVNVRTVRRDLAEILRPEE